jgi:uncharacterized protein with von Willebrand factor type A (vWA) domain
MLADLNDLLEAHRRGEDTSEQFREFMDRHGDFFPERPETVEELLDSLAGRAAAAQRMLASMTPEQREELMQLSIQAGTIKKPIPYETYMEERFTKAAMAASIPL